MLHEDAINRVLGEIKMVRVRAHYACRSHVIDQILWTMGLPEWVSALGNPNENGGWNRMIHMKWSNGVIGVLDGSEMWGWDDDPLRIMIVGNKSYAEASGLSGWFRRRKAYSSEIEELWEVEPG